MIGSALTILYSRLNSNHVLVKIAPLLNIYPPLTIKYIKDNIRCTFLLYQQCSNSGYIQCYDDFNIFTKQSYDNFNRIICKTKLK